MNDMPNIETTDQLQHWLVSACQELGLNVVGPDSDFFEAGGTSLTAIKLIAKADSSFGEDVLLPEDLFERSRIKDITASIQLRLADLQDTGSA
jgi:hypothetical protein